MAAELVLHPGEWYFGAGYAELRTLLGSCVAMTVWHPVLRCGGMCHYLLPRAPRPTNDDHPDARYGVHALHFMRNAMETRAPLQDYQISCFGGSDMFAGKVRTRVGEHNIELLRQWLHRHHVVPQQMDLGGTLSRTVLLELASGRITQRFIQVEPGAGAVSK